MKMLMYHAQRSGDRWNIYLGFRLVAGVHDEICYRKLLIKLNSQLKEGKDSQKIEQQYFDD